MRQRYSFRGLREPGAVEREPVRRRRRRLSGAAAERICVLVPVNPEQHYAVQRARERHMAGTPTVERETGFGPATSYLEGRRSNQTELLPRDNRAGAGVLQDTACL